MAGLVALCNGAGRLPLGAEGGMDRTPLAVKFGHVISSFNGYF